MGKLLGKMGRYDHVWLAMLPALYAVWAWGPGFGLEPDTYYHVGLAKLYATEGWVSTFPWLKYTVLGDPFPNVHLLEHLALAPFTRLVGPVATLKLCIVVSSTALIWSLYAILKRWDVPHPALWTFFGAYSSTLWVTYQSYVTGAACFFVLLLWFIDALWREEYKRVCVFAVLCMWSYTGGPILLFLTGLHLLLRRLWEGSWAWKLLGYVCAGVLIGLVVNPSFPHNMFHVWQELQTPWTRDEKFVPGEFFGAWWMTVDTKVLVHFAFGHLMGWVVLVMLRFREEKASDIPAASGAFWTFAILGASFVGGAKLLNLFFVVSVLAAPMVARQLRPWAWDVKALLMAGVVINALWSAQVSYKDMHPSGRPLPEEYQALGKSVQSLVKPGETVATPWDDFPGLFYFNPSNVYIAGMNPFFLHWKDPKKFDVYYQLYKGMLNPMKERLAETFDGARMVVVRREPRNQGELSLMQRLEKDPAFKEQKDIPKAWRIFLAQP